MDAFKSLTRSKSVPTVSTGAMLVGPDLARQWLTECEYTAQRPIYGLRIRLYQAEMEGGLWRLSDLRFARTPDGQAYLMNGYTRLSAIIQGGVEVPFTVTVVDVSNMTEVASEYSVMDQHRVRQTKDQLRGFNLESLLGFPLTDQASVARTAPILAAGFSSTRYGRFTSTIQFRLPYLMEWADPARILLEALHTGHVPDPPAKRITNAPILAVALVTSRFQPERSAAFWRNVAEGDGLRRGQPDWTLREFLGRLSTGTVKDYPAMARRTAVCWNAFYEERDLKFVSANPNRDGEWAPIKILGSPYDGRQTIMLYGNGAHVPGTEPEEQKPEAIYARAIRGEFPYTPAATP